jgi:hypothetical protein
MKDGVYSLQTVQTFTLGRGWEYASRILKRINRSESEFREKNTAVVPK